MEAASPCGNGTTSVTFDDLPSSVAVPNGYNNINWTNTETTNSSTNTSGYYTGIISPPNAIFNPYGNPMTMTCANSSLINLYSFVIAAAWYDNLQLTIVGYNSNVIIVNTTYTIQVFTASYLTLSGYTGLNTIVFSTSGGTKDPAVSGSGMQFAMDNICLSFQ